MTSVKVKTRPSRQQVSLNPEGIYPALFQGASAGCFASKTVVLSESLLRCLERSLGSELAEILTRGDAAG